LRGKAATQTNFRKAAEMEMADAKPLSHNKFKVQMSTNSITKALELALRG